MTPTPQLRWIERNDPVVLRGERFDNWQKVLQQFWIPSDEPYEEWLKVKDGEWRDVPLERKE